MSLETIIFYTFALLTAGSAVTLALTRNVIHAAWILFVVLFGMAGMYVFAGAEFLAMAQVIIYVGGILIVILFGVMLTQKVRGEVPRTGLINMLPGALLSTALFATSSALCQETSKQRSIRVLCGTSFFLLPPSSFLLHSSFFILPSSSFFLRTG